MTPELRQRANRVFAGALGRPAEERGRFLDEACGGDPALREVVESLLAHDAAADRDGFLAEPCPLNVKAQAAGAAPTLVQAAPAGEEPRPPRFPGYEVLGELGRGGMGVVYKARHDRLKRLVALKVIRAGADAEELARFRTEAEAAARLQHPNVVQIYEVGDHEGGPFCALELVEGGSLAGRLGGRPVAPRVAARLTETLARATQYAHQRGIVHRDLKPANVLLAGAAGAPLEQCVPKIADFGLAKRLDEDGGQTRTGAILGTPSYMAPEQTTGRPGDVGPAADVYALGAMLYELFTGRPPFQGASVLETLEQVRRQEPVPPRRLVPKLPRDLETICLKCLHKEPHRRYASAGGLADDLGRFLGHEPIQARPVPAWERVLFRVRRRPAAALAALTLGLVVAGSAGGYWLWHQLDDARRREEERAWAEAEAQAVTTEYFANVIYRWREFEGIGPVSEEEARRRNVTYRLRRRGGKVEQVDVLNGHLLPASSQGIAAYLDRAEPGAERHECSYQVKRGADGKPLEEVARDQAGQVLYTFHYTSPATGHYTDARGFPTARTASGAAYVRFVFDEQGFENEVWFLDRLGQPRADQRGVYGLRRRHDPRGLALEGTSVDARGQPTRSREGFARATSSFDDRGNCVEMAVFGADGRPCLDRNGVARVTMRYDDRGNRVERAFFGLNGEPALHKDGAARWAARYDGRGNRVEEAFFGPDGRPCLNNDWVATIAMRYDERGNMTEAAYFGADGQPGPRRDGVARWTGRYDERGYCVEATHFGADGRPVAASDGVARWTARRDDRGNRIEEAFFGPDARPVLRSSDGAARSTMRYDDRGNRIEEAHFGTDGQPAPNKQGYAKLTARYDDRGNRVEEAYFGTDGRPVANKDGVAKVTTRYDEDGNPVEMAFFDAGGAPTRGGDGVARWTARYDERGNRLEMAFFGTDGGPAPSKDGYAQWKARYDERGNQVEGAHFAADGRLVAARDGVARWTARDDDRGNRLEMAYFGADGQPALNREGIAKWTARYDERGNRTEEAYFGTDGQPVPNKDGVARLAMRYDDRGNRIEMAFFGTDGRPVPHRDGFARWAARHDARGNLTELAYFGADGRPALHKDGFARLTRRYDKHGTLIDEAFFGLDGRPLRLQVSVESLVPGGQAQRLGLRAGDVLLSYDGQEVVNRARLTRQRLTERPTDAPRELKVLRAGEIRTFAVSAGLLGVMLAQRAAPPVPELLPPPEVREP
jgi:hypothetical protein